MIIEMLKMCAFGPYRGTEEIDFTKYKGKIFQISGETGSGKTTIFDAVCFALFGEACGSLREKNGGFLRNQNVGEKDESYVQMSFTVGSGKETARYFVQRATGKFAGTPGSNSVSSVKRAVRGSKTAGAAEFTNPWSEVGKSSVIICRQQPDNTWKPECIGAREVTAFVHEITGLDAATFKQISVLAQGEFDRFLNESTKSRRKTLQDIFGTQIYENYENVIKAWSRTLKLQMEHFEEAFNKAADSLELDNESFYIAESHLLSERISSLLAEKGQRISEIERQRAELRRQLEENTAQREAVIRNNNDISAWQDAKNILRTLTDRQPEIDILRQELKLWRSAEEVRPEYDTWVKLKSDKYAKDMEKAEAEKFLSQALAVRTEKLAARDNAAARISERDILVGKTDSLKKILPRVQEVQRIRQETAVLSGQKEQAEKKLDEAVDQLRKTQNAMKELAERLEQEKQLAMSLDIVQDKLSRLNEKKKLAESLSGGLEKYRKSADELKSLRYDRDEASQALYAAAQEHNDRLSEYNRDAALVISMGLKKGCICPVCRQTVEELPPHRDFTSVVEWAVVDAAKKKLDSAQNKLNRISAEAAEKESECGVMLGALSQQYSSLVGGEIPLIGAGQTVNEKLAELNNEVMTASQELKQCTLAAANIGEIQNITAKMNAESERLQASISESEAVISSLEKQIAANSALENEKSRDIGNRTEQSVSEEIQSSSRKLSCIDEQQKFTAEEYASAEIKCAEAAGRLEEIKRQLEQLADGFDKAEALLDKKIQDSGFRNIGDVVECLRTREATEEQSCKIEAWEKDLNSAAAIEQERYNKIKGSRTVQELDGFEQKANEIAKAEKELTDEQTDCKLCMEMYSKAEKTAAAAAEKYSKIRKKADLINRIGSVVSGNDTRSIKSGSDSRDNFSLEVYVQMSIFENVLRDANRYLEQMSGGQYRLYLHTEANRKTSQSGLELDISDNKGGEGSRRSVSSLSGGERFMASFALAIGFSEYTQRNCVGHSTEMLFVDEGFSTLDPETRRTAFGVIEYLRSQNRTIGIVTHTDDMSSMTEEHRICVRKDISGSTIESYPK